MSTPGIRLRHLTFQGPQKAPASVTFSPGLNVVYGASDTGKSFIVEAIDFMLGGKPPLRDFRERIGYDRVLLGLETLSGEAFTLQRSAEGGSFRLYDGLHTDTPPDVDARELADQHSERSEENLSTFLLQRCGLAGKRVRKNKAGATQSLSFRNLARLVIVDETEIIDQRSPLSDRNPVADTPNFATFKLLLTGVDDSALTANVPKGLEVQSREAQLELLDQLLGEYRQNLEELTEDPADLQPQLERIEASLAQHSQQLSTSESAFRQLADRRRDLRRRVEEGRDRLAEVMSLLERFELLDRHYASDLSRLRGLEEGGSIFEALGRGPCPLCGAESQHHRLDEECDANVSGVMAAARSEIAKVELLRRELQDTRAELERERLNIERRLPRIDDELRRLAGQVEEVSAPLARLRTTYSEFADKRAQVRHALSVVESIGGIERRRAELETASLEGKDASVSDGDLPSAVAEEFAQGVESLLRAWHFPDAQRVYFDSKTRDLMIAGKNRISRGKGLRAITHAAFTIGILDYCRRHATPHPGFVVLDSPLLAYREPEGSEDDLTGTDLKEQFYQYLEGLPDDRQVVVMENTNPPAAIASSPRSLFFSANPHSERYGFFPIPADANEP